MLVKAAFSTDHLPLIFSVGLNEDVNRGNGLRKFNISLTKISNFITKLKIHLKDGWMSK